MTITTLLHPVSRVLMSIIFVASGLGKILAFQPTALMMAGVGFPVPEFFLVCAILMEIFGGLGLLVGFHTRSAASVLFVFVTAATIMFHTQGFDDPVAGQNQVVHLLKNIAILGGLLKFVAEGGGWLSVDRRLESQQGII